MFCAECGAPQPERPQSGDAVASVATGSSSNRLPEESAAQPVDTQMTSTPVDTPALAATQLTQSDQAEKPIAEAESVAPAAERHRVSETLHRASAAARGAIEDNVKRVEKIRHVSTVVLEEASYDASLRFVLAALALFLLVAGLLLLSKVMG